MGFNKKIFCLLILVGLVFYPFTAKAADKADDLDEDYHPVHIGIVNNAKENIHGFEFGLVNQAQKNFSGFQLGLISNVTKRSCDGFEAAIFYNDAGEEMHGLQLGLVNHTGSLDGVQIGILNFNDDTRYLGFFPFINAAF